MLLTGCIARACFHLVHVKSESWPFPAAGLCNGGMFTVHAGNDSLYHRFHNILPAATGVRTRAEITSKRRICRYRGKRALLEVVIGRLEILSRFEICCVFRVHKEAGFFG